MPRILKADLVRLYMSQSESNEVLLAENARLRARLTKAWKERDELEKVRKERDRSRSPRRNTEASAATTRLALDAMCRHERDEVVHEQRETIAQLHREIESLKNGAGSVGPLLLAVWESDGTIASDFVREKFSDSAVPSVLTYLGRIAHLNYHMNSLVVWGTSHLDRFHPNRAFASARAQP